jgi:DNA modification methylase
VAAERNHKRQIIKSARRQIEIDYRPIAQLKLDPRNPRTHSRRQIRQLARSIETFDFNVPILIDKDFKVIAGHGRVMAAQLLDQDEVPTICLEHLTDVQARAFMIADNRLTEISQWDERLLAEQLKELSELDLDFDLETVGFEMGEIDLRIEGLETLSQEQDSADVLSGIASGPAVSQPGDRWVLGGHQLLNGSAIEAADYARLMNGELAEMVFTDPPYNVPIEGHVNGLGKIHHREFLMGSGEMDKTQFTSFLSQAFALLARYSAEGSLQFICNDWRHLGEMLTAGHANYTELKNVCVWAKDNPGMGSLYRSQHELVFVFKKGRERHRNNVQLGRYGRNRSNVWRYPGAVGLRASEEGNLLALHPTVKPVNLVADAIMDCTARGDIVLDSFLGSGTTIIAAERTGRLCRGLELDSLYVDTIVRRWQKLTGGSVRHASTGRSFDDISAQREEKKHEG